MNNYARNNAPCRKGCEPARYGKGFPSECDCPEETDTKLSIDYAGASLNYAAERHTDIIAGSQLGGIIALPDLRDVNIDYNFDAMCAEFIYHKYGECGDGCKSLEDAWNLFSIDQDGAKNTQIRYVRGANIYGCPVFLDVPTNELEYWYAGWRPNGEFGYYQAKPVSTLPTVNGDPIVVSQDPTTKEPLVGTFPLTCILNNLLQNFGVQTEIGFQPIQSTPNFTATTDNVNGDFDIEWNDWYGAGYARHIGTGHILGTIDWTYKFDIKTGMMTYVVNQIYFNKVTYITDQGVPAGTAPVYLTLKGIKIGTTAQTVLKDHVQYNPNENWSWDLDTYIEGGPTFTLTPGQSAGPFNFLYLWTDWTEDDEGYLNISFRNTLSGWDGACLV